MNSARVANFKLWLLGGLLLALPLLSYPQAIFPPETAGSAHSFVFVLPWARAALIAAVAFLSWRMLRAQDGFSAVVPRAWAGVLALVALASLVSVVKARNASMSVNAIADSLASVSLAVFATAWGVEAGVRRLVSCCCWAAVGVVVYTLLHVESGSADASTLVNRNIVAD